MAKIIRCTCEECRHNEEQACNAGAIEVRSNGDNMVHSSAGTCCSTFEPKNDTYDCGTDESKNNICGCINH